MYLSDLGRSAKTMTLKPTRTRAFLKAFLWFFLLISAVSGVLPRLQGKAITLPEVLQMALLGSLFLGVGVAVMFTPSEISWDDAGFSIKTLFPGSGQYAWQQLEAYSSFGKGIGTFLIKFEGQQAFQIVPTGFRSEDWKAFRLMLAQRFPEKKTRFWFGPIPVRFGRK